MPRPPAAPPPADDGLRRVRAYLARAGLAAAAVTELAGDASGRRYVRVRAADGSSLVLLVHRGPIDAAALPFLDVAGLLARMDVPVPAVRDRAGDLGILALEDLGDVTLERFLASAPADRRRQAYAAAVDLIVRMQRRGRQLASPDHLPFTRAFDEALLMRELDFFVQHFLLGHRRAALSAAARGALDGELRALARALAAEPRVFCHRDFHSRNLMLRGGRLYVIDFQDARLGPDTYDLVSLLRDCYVRLEPAFVGRDGGALPRAPGRGRRPGAARPLRRPLRSDVGTAAPQGAGHLRSPGGGGRQRPLSGGRPPHARLPGRRVPGARPVAIACGSCWPPACPSWPDRRRLLH